MSIPQQLLIVFLILCLLPFAVTILWKLRLFPLGMYFVVTDLFFPDWAASHELLCIGLFAAAVLYAVLSWCWRIVRWRREQRWALNSLLARATPLYPDLYDKNS